METAGGCPRAGIEGPRAWCEAASAGREGSIGLASDAVATLSRWLFTAGIRDADQACGMGDRFCGGDIQTPACIGAMAGMVGAGIMKSSDTFFGRASLIGGGCQHGSGTRSNGASMACASVRGALLPGLLSTDAENQPAEGAIKPATLTGKGLTDCAGLPHIYEGDQQDGQSMKNGDFKGDSGIA